MPNWCSNVLLAAGEPEEVAEFRILSAQHTEAGDPSSQPDGHMSNPSPCTTADPLSLFNERLVGLRGADDLSFTAIPMDEAQPGWGTQWDVCNETHNSKPDRGTWKLPHHDLLMTRLEQWGMTTAWSPPRNWLARIADVFPAIDFSLGYEEEGNGDFGVLRARGNQFSAQRMEGTERSKPKAMEKAISEGRKSMPLHRKPVALLRAIWDDNEKAVRSELSKGSVADLDAGIHSRWSALMHAGFAGSQKVADVLLAAGADPLHRVELGCGHGFGLNDILLDLNTEQKPEFVQARQAIFLRALDKTNAFASHPLGSGRDALNIAMCYQMGPLIPALFKHCPLVLNQKNGDGMAVQALVDGFPSSAIKELIGKVGPGQIKGVSSQIITALIRLNTPGSHRPRDNQSAVKDAHLLWHLHDLGLMKKDEFSMICKEIPVKPAAGDDQAVMVGGALAAVFASERAMRAIDATILRPTPQAPR